MEQLVPVSPLQATPPIREPLQPADAPLKTLQADGALKASNPSGWGFISHPSGLGATASTASGPSTLGYSSTIYNVSGSFTRLSSLDSNDPYTSGSRSGTPAVSKRQYVAVLPAEPSAWGALRIPPNAVAMADMSPAWSQYQATSIGGPLTPVYCSLTPTRTACQPPSVQAENIAEPIQQASPEGVTEFKGSGSESGRTSFSVSGKASENQQDSRGGGRRKSLLLLNGTPLEVKSLPEQVQALIQTESPQQKDSPKHFPEWFDAQSGYIRRECLPELPSFRMNLNTSVAKLSAASRVHRRTRLPGETAKATPNGYQQVTGRATRRISCPDAALLCGRSDSTARLSQSTDQATPSIRGGEQSPLPFEVSDALAARNRRVRFATVASAHDYKERSPASSTCAEEARLQLRAASLDTILHEDGNPTGSPQMQPDQKGIQARALEMIQRMTDMIERLLIHPALAASKQSTEELESSLRLLQAFKEECAGRLPALCFFADTLENCQQLVEQKLPEEERKLLLELIEESKQPLLSRDAIIKLHRIRREMRHPKDLDLLLIPLEVLQRLRVCDRRRALSGLSLYAAACDEPLLDIEQKQESNVFLMKCSACGVVSSRPWIGCASPRRFASDILRRCQEQIAAAKRLYEQNERHSFPQGVPQAATEISLVGVVEASLRETKEYGVCSLALLSLDNAGEKLRFTSCGSLRVMVMRRSRASGVLYRLAQSPWTNAAAAAETQLFRWPSKGELLNVFSKHKQPSIKFAGTDSEAAVDAGTRRQALMRAVEWAEIGNGWSSRGLVQQELAVQEGDFFVVADDILFDVISSEEIRYLFSCCLTSLEVKDLTDVPVCTIPSCLPTVLKRLWKQRVPNHQALLQHFQQRQQRFGSHAFGRRAVAEAIESCPLDLTVTAGWIHKKLDN
ncbi:hypothetical protein Efla_002011 [Eimeria flavescens]